MARDPAFANQFQWEVDRWVFRARHRGEPIEVTSDERDRLIALHDKRLANWNRAIIAFCAVAFSLMAISFGLPLALVGVPLFYYIGTAATMPIFLWFSYVEGPRHVRGRPLLGMPLGQRGRLARKASAFSAGDLTGSFLVAVVASVSSGFLLLTSDTGGHPLLALAICSTVWITTVALGRMMVLRWAQLERDRRRVKSREVLQRARDLRVD